jgi:glycosyltransferase involved in cell wall biosynthesis
MWTIFHTEASLGWGGQEIRILNESLGMRERGHRVLILAEKESTLIKKATQYGFETKPLSFQKKDYPATLFKVLRLIKELKPNIINTHSSKDSWIVSIASRVSSLKPFIIRTRHLSTPVATNIAGSIIYRSLPHKIITTGEAIREQLITRNHVLPDKIVSIPTGIDLNVFNSEKDYKDIRQELSLPDQTPLIGMVSVLRSWKGHDYFIEATELTLKKLPQARFLIVGDGPRRETISRMIREKNLSNTILMLGHREDIPDIMSSLDILVHPSYANEGVPQSILQGMAMKVPVIASNLKPLAEVIIDGGSGLVVPAKDSKKLAEKIMLLFKDNELKSKLGNNGRKLVLDKFSIGRMIDSIEELYKSLGSTRTQV